MHFANIEKLRMFINHYFPELLQFTGVDKAVYNNGQLFRLPLCTKKGRNLPLEFMDDREDDFQSAMLCSISSTSVLLAVDKRIFKKQLHSVIPINYEDVSELEKLFLENISRFQKYCDEYGDWIKIGLKMCSSGFHVQTFIKFSKLSSKFDEKECLRKWNSFQTYEKNMNSMIILMKKHGVTMNYDSKLDNFFEMLKLKYDDDNVRFLSLLFHGEFQERIKYDSETGEFYVFLKNGKLIMILHVFHHS